MAKPARKNRLWLARFPLHVTRAARHISSNKAVRRKAPNDPYNVRTHFFNVQEPSPSPVTPLNPLNYLPMDPLSFSASIITVVALAATVAKQLNLLHTTLRDASGLLSALVNEISDLRIILEACRSAVTELYRTSNSINPATPLSDAEMILDRTKLHLEELEKVLLSCLGSSSDPTNISRGVKFRWLREKGTAEALQHKLRDSKQNLIMLLESQSVMAISGMQIAVQEFSVGTTEFQTSSTDKMERILYELSDHMTQIREIHAQTSQFNEKLDELGQIRADFDKLSTLTRPPTYSERSEVNTSNDSHRPNNNAIQLRASCYRKSCRPWCSCRCHVRREIRTPGLAKSFIGSLFVGYSGIPMITQECDEKQCRKRSTSRIILSYQFPGWFWERSLFTSFMSASLAGPEMLIRVSNTIPFACETYQFCMDGNVGGLQRLFEIGKASPFDLDPEGCSLLHNALRNNHFDLCHLLISSGSDLYQEDHTGLSAFHYAWDSILIDPLEPHRSSKKQALLSIFPQDEGGLDERQFNRIHKSVLGIIGTSLKDELSISTSTIDLVDNMGRTPLFWAASRSDVEATTLLLAHGASSRIKSWKKGTSPLLAAARTGNAEIVEQLLRHGADVNVRSMENLTPLHFAATLEDGYRCVQVLLEAGADVNSLDDENRAPLLTATCQGRVDIAKLLLDAGARIDQLCEDGWTALSSGVFWNVHATVRLLLERGAGVKQVTGEGETLLHIAVRYGDAEILEILASHGLEGVDVDAKTVAGETVSDIANGREEGAEWKEAFRALLESIQGLKPNELVKVVAPVAEVVEVVEVVEVDGSDIPEDVKTMQHVVKAYVFDDDDSDSDHFEDALEIL